MEQLHKKDIFPNDAFHIDRTLIRGTSRTIPHNHDFYEIFIVEEGTLEHRRGESDEWMPPDSMALVYPEESHSFVRQGKQALCFFNVAFSTAVFDEAWDVARRSIGATDAVVEQRLVSLPHELSRQFLRRMKWMRNESRRMPTAVQHTLLVSLLADMLTVVAVGSGNVSQMPHWLRSACEEMRKPENLSGGIARFVELSGKTQEHLTRSMKKYSGQTPSAYVNSARLERAAEALTSTDKSVLEIMLDVGFQNTSYFNKLFKEKYHMSPRKYRIGSLAIFGKSV